MARYCLDKNFDLNSKASRKYPVLSNTNAALLIDDSFILFNIGPLVVVWGLSYVMMSFGVKELKQSLKEEVFIKFQDVVHTNHLYSVFAP